MALVDGAAYEAMTAALRDVAVLLKHEQELADDLADVLARMVVGWKPIVGHDLSTHPDVQRVMRRYRVARGRQADDAAWLAGESADGTTT